MEKVIKVDHKYSLIQVDSENYVLVNTITNKILTIIENQFVDDYLKARKVSNY